VTLFHRVRVESRGRCCIDDSCLPLVAYLISLLTFGLSFVYFSSVVDLDDFDAEAFIERY